MLWYLHLCSQNGIVVTEYKDHASGKMEENENGSGRFIEVQLNPVVIVNDIGMIEKANELHLNAHEFCFIANSVNFPVLCKPIIKLSSIV
jgi:organic hydroperoxide reductase OsmC/OhrA